MTTFITPLLRKAALTAAGLTITAGALAGPLGTEAHAAPTTPATVLTAKADKGDTILAAKPKADKGDKGNGQQKGQNGNGNGNADKNNGNNADNGKGNADKNNGGNGKGNGNGSNADNGKGNNGNGNGNKGNGNGNKSGDKELAVKYEPQPNFYYCGPAATRNALTATGRDINMDDLAKQMGTTEAGTNSALDITAALNKATGATTYTTTEIRGQLATADDKTKLRDNIITALDAGRAVVANIAGTATDTDGGIHSFEGGHYITVHAYRNGGQQVKIADSANPNTASYWINTDNLADWIATRGYSH